MRFYETLYIVDSNLENKALEKEMGDIGKELEKTKSKIINHRVWGKKRLAYTIQRQKYGSYIILQYAGGELGKIADIEIRVPHFGYSDRIQEIHIKIIHILILLIEKNI